MAVTISYEEFQELLDTKTRVDVVVEQIIRKGYIEIEQVLRILGTKDAIQHADELKEISKREWERMTEQREDSQGTLTEVPEDE